MPQSVKGLARQAWDKLFPNHTCLVCGDEIRERELPNICVRCSGTFAKHPEPRQGNVHTPFVYVAPVSGLVLALKYANGGLVAQTFAPAMAECLGGAEYDIIVPVPLFRDRQKKRGYNQAEVLAREISHISGVSVAEVLGKVRATIPQEDMTSEQRMANQKDAYAVRDGANVKGKRVLLVDDVVTSGATTDECAKVLADAGAADIIVVAIARPNK